MKGQDGQDGQDGRDGTNGTNGTNGSDGKSAYQIWLDAGNSGTEAQFLASLIGPQGPSNYDFTHSNPITHSNDATLETVTFVAQTQGTQWIAASADLDIDVICTNDASNYIVVENTSSSDIDVFINSISYNGAAVTAHVAGGTITVAANTKHELGFLRYKTGSNTYAYIITHVEI